MISKDSTDFLSKQKQQQEWDAWVEKTIIDEDEVIPENETPELITGFQKVDKCVPTIFDRARIEATLNDIVHDFQLGIESSQVKVNLTAPTLTFPGIEAHEPYSIIDKPTTSLIYLNNKDKIWVMYLVEIVKFCNATLEKVLKEVKLKIFQSEPWKKPPLIGIFCEWKTNLLTMKRLAYLYNKDLFFLKNENTEEKKYILSLHKIHAERFPKVDLEEKINHWVRKEFKNFNEDARLTIQHWKDSWHKLVTNQNQRRVRNNPEDYFSNHRITEVVRITTDQPHGLDFMEQIIMIRENDKLDSFSKADFKYLNKNDIEDLYYLGRNKKVNYLRNRELPNQGQLNRTNMTFPGIEAYEPYSIVDKPNTGLIYLINKDEKRVMYLVEIVKFVMLCWKRF
ncbi:hypothetical protein Tco_0200844 [Tanacetum coccineum]